MLEFVRLETAGSNTSTNRPRELLKAKIRTYIHYVIQGARDWLESIPIVILYENAGASDIFGSNFSYLSGVYPSEKPVMYHFIHLSWLDTLIQRPRKRYA